MISIAVSLELFDRIQEAVSIQNTRTLKHPLSRNAWIVRAIQYELDHARRNRAEYKHGRKQAKTN